MQKVPLKFITVMQSKRLQNCNRYKMIYFIHIAQFSPADAQFTIKLCCKRKALLQHQNPESNRLFSAYGNKTSLFATASHSSPLSWPLQKNRNNLPKKTPYVHSLACHVLQAVLMFCCTHYTIAKISGQQVGLKHDLTGHANFYSNNSATVTFRADAISNSTTKEGSFFPLLKYFLTYGGHLL